MDNEVIFKTEGIKILYRRLLIAGHTKEEASMGLGPLEKGEWTVKELQYLDFHKHLSTRP